MTDICFGKDPHVAPVHAKISANHGRFTVSHLDTLLGTQTLKNGRALAHPSTLKTGDELTIGQQKLQFVSTLNSVMPEQLNDVIYFPSAATLKECVNYKLLPAILQLKSQVALIIGLTAARLFSSTILKQLWTGLTGCESA